MYNFTFYDLILFIIGAAVGSFLNVLSQRYESDKQIFDFRIIGGRSRCPSCGKTLRWYELVPILSFIIQGRKCRGCRAKISWQYPLVELASGLVAVLVPLAIGKTLEVNLHRVGGELPIWHYLLSIIFILAGWTMIFLAAVDARLKIIPDQSNILIAVLGIIAVFIRSRYGLFGDLEGSFLGHYAALFGLRDFIWLNFISAAVFGAVFFGLIIFLSRGRGMGMGDLKLVAAAGLLIGWPDIILAVALSFIIGALGSIIMMALGGRNLKSLVPFGPYIVLGILLTIVFGREIMEGYFKLFP